MDTRKGNPLAGRVVSPYSKLLVLNDPRLNLDLSSGNSLVVARNVYHQVEDKLTSWTDVAFVNVIPTNRSYLETDQFPLGETYELPIFSAPNDVKAGEMVRERLTPSLRRFLVKFPEDEFPRLYEVRPDKQTVIVRSLYQHNWDISTVSPMLNLQQKDRFKELLRKFGQPTLI